MARVEFEPTIQVFERVKTVYALDRVATVIGNVWDTNVFYRLVTEKLHKVIYWLSLSLYVYIHTQYLCIYV
jgi:hypothetical protein